MIFLGSLISLVRIHHLKYKKADILTYIFHQFLTLSRKMLNVSTFGGGFYLEPRLLFLLDLRFRPLFVSGTRGVIAVVVYFEHFLSNR